MFMRLSKFVEAEMKKYDLPELWLHEVQLIADGKSSADSARERGVTKDAVKAQRKKVFKKLNVDDGRDLLVNLLHVAVTLIPSKE
jgi:DNA-binding CsgD family transcriptional regulator